MNRLLLVLFVLLAALILTSCGPLVVTCPPESLVNAPVLDGPGMWEVVDSLTPTLSWSFIAVGIYPYDSTSCIPEEYTVHLSTGPDFTDNLGGDVNGKTPSFTPGTPLEPGKQYAWGVYATSGGATSPYGGSRYFFTGPVCATEALVAPTLLWPPDGGVVNADVVEDTADGPMPMLKWEYPDPCLPEGYRIDLSTDPSFVDTSLSGGTGHPSTRWMAGQPMEDCTTYYWRVAPINDITLGPFSETWSFDMAVDCGPSLPELVTPFVEPLKIPWWILDVNAFCRQGPGQFYPAIANLLAGESYPVDGRNADNSWFVLKLADERLCWISAITGHLDGDADDVPIRKPPATPTPTVTPPPTDTPTPVVNCSKYNDDPKACMSNLACEYIFYQTGGGYCRNK